MSPTSLLLGMFIGAAIAAVITYLLVDRRHRNASLESLAARAIADGRANDLIQRTTQLEANLRQAADERTRLESARATLAAQLDGERQKTVDQLKLIEERVQFVQSTENHLKDAFARVSSETLQVGNKQLLDLAATRFAELTTNAAGTLEAKKLEMHGLLQPVRQTLDQYRVELAKLEESRKQEQGSVKEQLTRVAQTQELLSRETTSLSRALSRSEVRGRWGELQLQKLMEMSGLTHRVDFDLQVSVDGDAGKLRPDCVVNLPNRRRVLVDAKTIFDAFNEAARCEPGDDDGRTNCLKRHARQVRSRIDELGGKAYWEKFGESADYVVLFMPGEPFLYAAVEHDAELIEYGLRKRVLVASPTTLIGLLRVIEHGWERTDAHENIEKVRELAAELHKRVATVAEHFEALGDALNKASEKYNDTLRSLERNVFTQARKIEKLGVSGPKELPTLDETDVEAGDLGKQWKTLPDASTLDDGGADEVAEPAA